VGALSYKLNWGQTTNDLFATNLSLFYNGQSGRAFTYVVGGRNGRNVNNETGSSSRNRSISYIPASASDIVLVEANGLSPAQQWTLLDAFIEDDKHLKDSRGGYAEKNGSWAPFGSQFDFALRQNVGIKVGNTTQKLQVSFDIINFANFLNQDWGVVYNIVGDFNNSELLEYEGLADDGRTPTFSFTNDNLGNDKYSISSFASRWRMRFGVRYLFN
jgi:hypothetical protein